MNYGHAMENEFLARKYGITRKSDNFFKKETIAVFHELLAFEKMKEILKEEGKINELKQHIQDMKMKIYWQLFDFPSIIIFQTKYIKILEKIGKKKKKITNNQIILMTEEITKEYEKKLKREQRKLSKRCKLAKDSAKKLSDSKNYQKQKKKVAKIHNKIRNKRKDFINKLSTKIINNHDIICIEDLNIKGMLKNHKLAKSISDVSWSEFVRQLEYKANWYGRKIVKVPTFYPSSKTCSSCGNIKETLTLSERIYHCECCGLEIDRDYNASINILRKGLEILKEEKVS